MIRVRLKAEAVEAILVRRNMTKTRACSPVGVGAPGRLHPGTAAQIMPTSPILALDCPQWRKISARSDSSGPGRCLGPTLRGSLIAARELPLENREAPELQETE